MRKKKFRTSTGFEPMAAALALQCSTNWAMKNHTLGAGQFVESILTREWNETWNDVNCAVYFRSSHNLHSMSQKSLRKLTRPRFLCVSKVGNFFCVLSLKRCVWFKCVILDFRWFHTFFKWQVKNNGPSVVDSSVVNIVYPDLYSSSKTDSYLLYLLQIEVSISYISPILYHWSESDWKFRNVGEFWTPCDSIYAELLDLDASVGTKYFRDLWFDLYLIIAIGIDCSFFVCLSVCLFACFFFLREILLLFSSKLLTAILFSLSTFSSMQSRGPSDMACCKKIKVKLMLKVQLYYFLVHSSWMNCFFVWNFIFVFYCKRHTVWLHRSWAQTILSQMAFDSLVQVTPDLFS